ncbi:lysophospholipase L1-like esterase [Streptomyces aurantiacus]|uniref:SGNH/GDSL hydrolase family protein n=1 Tax=Streptomyces aurantiacus TaxID=47760 RepID=UPI0027917E5C|nr:SGNH/GDSL hydrolase family protein [Streptomyces aurantiacus]MDQ0774297.1 lysophospholipase L1-like esterase [Streptomyces aurantiacus]
MTDEFISTTTSSSTGTRRTGRLIDPSAADDGWVRTWAASPQAPEASTVAVEPFADATLRQVVRVSGGGRRIRIRFTNEYGTAPLVIGAAQVGLAAPGGGVRPGSERVLTFGGSPTAAVPAGAPILSDPVDLTLPALSRLTVSLYLPGHVESCTCHGTDVQTGWQIPGDAVAASALPAGAEPLPARALISAVEVLPDAPDNATATATANADATAIVALGDSLTDGVGSTPDADRRWPDVLAERLAEHGGPAVHVSNQGIGGNRLLKDGFGVSALARFDRDVLATPGLGHVVVFEGMNDIALSFAPRDAAGPMAEFFEAFAGTPVTTDDIIAGYRQLIARAHGRGARIYAATLTPYGGSDAFSSEGENARRTVNAWIRTSGAFDAVLDFDAVWRDPDHPGRIRDGFHEGDHIHGNDAGYTALADSVDLSLFK